MASSTDRTLKQEFENALSLYSEIFANSSIPDLLILSPVAASSDYIEEGSSSFQNLSATSEHYQTQLKEAIKCFEEARTKSENLSLFSLNERIEDVNTNDIKYEIDYG